MKPRSFSRREALLVGAGGLTALIAGCGVGGEAGAKARVAYLAPKASEAYAASPFRQVTDAEWKTRLSPAAYNVMRHEGTETPFTSKLTDEQRAGTFLCAGCHLPLFKSDWIFHSGTGWPSFYQVLPGAVETKTDRALGMTRVEYHCAQCLGHHGHVFEDGPPPTGLRYCNNGVALEFVPAKSA